MDPDENLEEQRELWKWLNNYSGMLPYEFGTNLDRYLQLVGALDEWMSRGGMLPTDWNN